MDLNLREGGGGRGEPKHSEKPSDSQPEFLHIFFLLQIRVENRPLLRRIEPSPFSSGDESARSERSDGGRRILS